MLKGLKNFNLPEVEEKVLKFWRENKIFEKSLAKRKGKKPFRFYEGPPYANGQPGIHHVLARVFKDAVLRYKSMQGYFVPRRAGWDTHGLPIELATEKELGIKSKNEIEKFGIDLFNQKAKASVWRYKPEWERLTERIGYWLDLKNAYITYENNYLESLWWIFKKIFEKGFLKQSYKVVPYCPRCQTPLSSHELGQPGVYKKTKDPSIYVKFKVKSRGYRSDDNAASRPKVKKNEFLLVWTTTPWTLPANVAVAVNPKLTYTKYKINGDYYWSYSTPPFKEGEKVEPIEKISGKKLIGLKYEPLYKSKSYKLKAKSYFLVLGADFVSTEEGTGLVHIAPAFGEDDFNLMKDRIAIKDIPVTVDEKGKVKAGFPGAGKFVKEADKDIIADLVKKNKIYASAVIEHEYPFCWRCGVALIYFSRLSWFIEMSRLRTELLAANKKINWIPAYLKDGRFGEWLKEAKDWAVSRERYWGAPLPIWKCG
ncbi:MAG: class I tRNA ligase family protein, partial [Patescibacteria group bacterium]